MITTPKEKIFALVILPRLGTKPTGPRLRARISAAFMKCWRVSNSGLLFLCSTEFLRFDGLLVRQL